MHVAGTGGFAGETAEPAKPASASASAASNGRKCFMAADDGRVASFLGFRTMSTSCKKRSSLLGCFLEGLKVHPYKYQYYRSSDCELFLVHRDEL